MSSRDVVSQGSPADGEAERVVAAHKLPVHGHMARSEHVPSLIGIAVCCTRDEQPPSVRAIAASCMVPSQAC